VKKLVVLFVFLLVAFGMTSCLYEHAHQPGDAIIVKEATCNAEGTSQIKCTECGKIINTVEIPKTNKHVEEILTGVAVGCEVDGKTEGKVCSICGTILVEQSVIPALGHSFGEWVVVNYPTVSEEGLQERICKCGKKETQTIEKLKASENLEFSLNSDNKSYSVIGVGECRDEEIVIPDKYNGLPVTGIGDSFGHYAFSGCDFIRSIIIPDSVITIFFGAFMDCTSLKSIDIPDSVTSDIPDLAFKNCTSLTHVTIPDKVAGIGNSAFYGCTSLESIYIGNSVLYIDWYAFEGCSSLGSVYIGESVVEIRGSAFYGCESLTSVALPHFVTKIGDQAFYNCTSLEIVSMDNSVLTIDEFAFYGCTSLEEVNLPDSITTIGRGVFWGCESLKNVELPDKLTSIDNSMFVYCEQLETVYIPGSVEIIAEWSFSRCTSLITISFGGTMDQWNAIEKEDNWNTVINGFTVQCTDGTIVYDGDIPLN